MLYRNYTKRSWCAKHKWGKKILAWLKEGFFFWIRRPPVTVARSAAQTLLTVEHTFQIQTRRQAC